MDKQTKQIRKKYELYQQIIKLKEAIEYEQSGK